ncbi:MAG: ABC transporter [Betaproteobacteria bacterium]|jgi:cholesterol transport system auxiliary component|nr:MAG: ABC transporter [Betaproteobacteria bacterium]
MNRAGRRPIVNAIFLMLAIPLLSNCALMSPPKTEPKKEVLSKLPPELPQQKSQAASVLVFPPETQAIYDTTQIAYAIEPYQVAYFSQHEWGETPSQMLQPLLVRTLQNTHRFNAVLTPPHAGRTTYALRTEIVELLQDFRSQPATVQLTLRIRLSDDAANRLIATRDISLREPMLQKTPEAGVAAANEATAKALLEVARFVLDKTS